MVEPTIYISIEEINTYTPYSVRAMTYETAGMFAATTLSTTVELDVYTVNRPSLLFWIIVDTNVKLNHITVYLTDLVMFEGRLIYTYTNKEIDAFIDTIDDILTWLVDVKDVFYHAKDYTTTYKMLKKKIQKEKKITEKMIGTALYTLVYVVREEVDDCLTMCDRATDWYSTKKEKKSVSFVI